MRNVSWDHIASVAQMVLMNKIGKTTLEGQVTIGIITKGKSGEKSLRIDIPLDEETQEAEASTDNPAEKAAEDVGRNVL